MNDSGSNSTYREGDIENAAFNMYLTDRHFSAAAVTNALCRALRSDLIVNVPVQIEDGDQETDADGNPMYSVYIMPGPEEKYYYPCFTTVLELLRGEEVSAAGVPLKEMMERALKDPKCAGILVNPFGDSIILENEKITELLKAVPESRFSLIDCDITRLHVDAIVNAANRHLAGGGGVDGAIHEAAGPRLKNACAALNGCNVGEAKVTRGFNLYAEHIIHTVGPHYHGQEKDNQLLAGCYLNSLDLAKQLGCHTIAFPCISSGAYHFPLEEAFRIAVGAISWWFDNNRDYVMDVYYCVRNHGLWDLCVKQIG